MTDTMTNKADDDSSFFNAHENFGNSCNVDSLYNTVDDVRSSFNGGDGAGSGSIEDGNDGVNSDG